MSDSELLAQITSVYFHAPFSRILTAFKHTYLCRIRHDYGQHNPDSGSPMQAPGRTGKAAARSGRHRGGVSGRRYSIRRTGLAPLP